MSNQQFIISTENIIEYAAYLKNEERAAATVEKYIRNIDWVFCSSDSTIVV